MSKIGLLEIKEPMKHFKVLPEDLVPDEVWNQILDGFNRDVSGMVIYSTTTDDPNDSFLERLFIESAERQIKQKIIDTDD